MRKRFIDIGANLTDPQFVGVYRGKRKHADDFKAMMERAREAGVERLLVTGSCLAESRHAVELAKAHPGVLYATVGVHPCSAKQVPEDPVKGAKYWSELETLARTGAAEGVVKAFGELGLDYDRLHYAPKALQIEVFKQQLEVATRLDLPLFLHSRACATDFAAIMRDFLPRLPRGGVVHSFTGTAAEARELVELGLYIGVNGCSLKTQENLEVVQSLPLNRLMLETDGPWCEIRPSHASHKYTTPLPWPAVKPEKFAEGSMVRGRCEPCAIGSVAEVVAAVHGVDVEAVSDIAYENTQRLFAMSD